MRLSDSYYRKKERLLAKRDRDRTTNGESSIFFDTAAELSLRDIPIIEEGCSYELQATIEDLTLPVCPEFLSRVLCIIPEPSKTVAYASNYDASLWEVLSTPVELLALNYEEKWYILGFKDPRGSTCYMENFVSYAHRFGLW